MDLSAPGLFLYLLFVVTLYASPVVVVLLIVAYRRGRLLRALKTTVLALPAIALAFQLTFYGGLGLASLSYQSQKDHFNELFPDDMTLYDGRIIGHEESRGGFVYTRYQFDVDVFYPEKLELLVPPANVTGAATVELERPKPAIGPAQLAIRNAGSYYSARHDDTPREYLQRHYPGLAGRLTDDPFLILTVYPGRGRSSVTTYNGPAAKHVWRSQMATVDF